jgi:hypothetical protein
MATDSINASAAISSSTVSFVATTTHAVNHGMALISTSFAGDGKLAPAVYKLAHNFDALPEDLYWLLTAWS